MKISSLAVIIACSLQLAMQLSRAQQCSPPTISLPSLTREAAYIGSLVYRDSRQSIFPSIHFSCSGNITKWTIVASEVGGGSRYPQFSIWRNIGGTNWENTGHSRLTDSDSTAIPFLYEKTLTQPLPFTQGDILGVYTPPVPKLSFKHQHDGGMRNYYIAARAEQLNTFDTSGIVTYTADDIPLLTIETTAPDCVSGIISRDLLLIKAGILNRNTTNVVYREATQSIIPDLSFPCSGEILRFTVGGLMDLEAGNQYPELQVWSRDEEEGEWFKTASVSSTAEIVRTENLNVFQFVPSPPLSVEQGDIFGFYQPYSTSSRMKMYLQGFGPLNYYYIAQLSAAQTFRVNGLTSTANRLPLITMEISVNGTTSTITPHTSTSSILPNPTHTPHPPPPNTAHTRINIGGLVAGVMTVMMLIIVCTVVIVVLAVRHTQRRRESQNDISGILFKVTVDRDNDLGMSGQVIVPDSGYHDLEYNQTYTPKNPEEIIQAGHRKTLTFKTNEAYNKTPLPRPPNENPLPRTPSFTSELEHTYESIDYY